ncbi:cell cycle checkpoint protein RAD17-like [Ruditapes philippinarum]|uniref:cell cycle checkpoint protein RAD17-like n=1 Tax=Ruditapes philippinarum TaxID=129788 RepID=UPI00295B0C4D|nr:cell cycle checkpoint protein RAD17-like [Ruditapes philippinarum]
MSRKQSKLTSLWADDDDDDCIILDPLPVTCSSTRKTDKPVVKVSSTKKATQWVSSAFDGFDDFSDVKSKPPRHSSNIRADKTSSLKRPHQSISNGHEGIPPQKLVTRRANSGPDITLWSDKYAPTNQGDLAVHKKKIADVEQWISGHIQKKKLPPILLLTGPAGVGKTATVKVLAKELRCELHEWSNPLADDYSEGFSTSSDWKSRSRIEAGISSSQKSQFQEFLLRANKYNTLDIFGGGGGVMTRRIILVEDFPNMFFREAAPFHDILRRYVQVGGSPLIFIVSDSTSGDSNERLLFPKDLQAQLNIENISFNPVAMTSMTKILTKVATEESLKGSHKFTVPSKSVIESIAMASAGDIRGAINALQFACLKDTCDLAAASYSKGKTRLTKKSSTTGKKGSTTKKTLSKTSSSQKDEELMSIGGRDTSLFLFRALGKILYCKRTDPGEDEENRAVLPSHLSQYYRDPLQVDPEDVVERSHLSGDFFGAYLHQNYVEFFSSIEDLVTASEYISDADYLTIDWASRSALQQYAASVATRGIMFSNSSRARHTDSGGGGLGWKPLHKPQWYTASKQARQNSETARYLFRSYRAPPVVLQTELIPYTSLINTTLHDTGQISFMQEICRFSSHKTSRYEKLDEKEIDMEDDDASQSVNQKSEQSVLPGDTDDVISNSQSNLKSSQEEEEEYIIEDYDD